MGFQSPNYTQVPDELFDELLPVLSGAELKVLLYIIRRTFGFKRESDNISLAQMLNGLTTRDGRALDGGVGLSKKTLLGAIHSLEERNVIITQRRQSVERGNEATSYRLNVIVPSQWEKTTPPLGEKLHQGGGGIITPPLGGKTPPSPRGKNSPTQYTDGETVEGDTGFEASKLRRVPLLKDEGSLAASPSGAPAGFSTPGDVLRSGVQPQQVRAPGSPPQSAVPAAEAQSQPAGGEEPARDQRENRPETASEDWQRIQFHIDEFRRDLGDKATLRASTTRAYNLYVRSGVPIAVYVERLFQARVITQEHTASITSQGEDTAFKIKRRTKAAYFFSVLEDLLNLLPPEERARRDRLRAQAAKRVEEAKGVERQAPKHQRGEDNKGDDGKPARRGRDSDGPYAAYIEH